jgi:hypothetical protein
MAVPRTAGAVVRHILVHVVVGEKIDLGAALHSGLLAADRILVVAEGIDRAEELRMRFAVEVDPNFAAVEVDCTVQQVVDCSLAAEEDTGQVVVDYSLVVEEDIGRLAEHRNLAVAVHIDSAARHIEVVVVVAVGPILVAAQMDSLDRDIGSASEFAGLGD